MASLSWLSWTMFVLGFPDQAHARSREALSEARKLPHRNTLAYALAWDSVRSQLCRDRRATQAGAEELISLATEQGFPLWSALGMILRGWALAVEGQVEAGLGELSKGLAAWRATGAEGWVPYFLTLLGDAYSKAHRPCDGLESGGRGLGQSASERGALDRTGATPASRRAGIGATRRRSGGRRQVPSPIHRGRPQSKRQVMAASGSYQPSPAPAKAGPGGPKPTT